MIWRIEWKNGLWIAHIIVNGEPEQAVSKYGLAQLCNLCARLGFGVPA